jgi:hypothetical protein
VSWWSHEVVIGNDATRENYVTSIPAFSWPGDTLLDVGQNTTTRQSLRYTTTVQGHLASTVALTVSAGGDGWQNTFNGLYGNGTMLRSGSFETSLYRNPDHNRGGFVQGQLGLLDAIYLTYGLRAEWNRAFGEESNPNLAPRYGIAAVHDFGSVSIKARGSYGQSTRPPNAGLKRSERSTSVAVRRLYGEFDRRLANPDLGPESQRGAEGGLEMYFGTRASLIVTRYNQTVDHLITDIYGADSLRSLLPNPTLASSDFRDADGYGYIYQSQVLNAVSLRNQGWEVQGSVNAGPMTVRSTYSYTKSRSLGITPKYASIVPSYYLQFRKGASFTSMPEHTMATTVAYNRPSTTVSLTFNRIGVLTTYGGGPLFTQSLTSSIRLTSDRSRATTCNCEYQSPGYFTSSLDAMRRFSPRFEGVLQILNLGNFHQGDLAVIDATIGRQTKVGFRARW